MSPRARQDGARGDGARPRRVRTATESLLSIVLVLESLLIFFLTLVVFALRVLEPAAAFIGGSILFAVLLIASRSVRWPAGVVIGWVLQAVLVATGILVPLMYIVGIGFAALYGYCFVTARRLDARNFPRTTE